MTSTILLTVFIAMSGSEIQVIPVKEFSNKADCEEAAKVLVERYVDMTDGMSVSRSADGRSNLVTGSYSCDVIPKSSN